MRSLGGETGAEIEFADGESARFDLVIGADGIESATDAAVDGGETPPRYSGTGIVFGCTPAGSDAREASEVNTAHQFFADGAYMLVFTGGGDAASKKQHNIALCLRHAGSQRAESAVAWRAKPAAKEEAIALMREGCMPRSAIDVAEACDRFFDVGVHYHDVMESWSDARRVAALVGGTRAMRCRRFSAKARIKRYKTRCAWRMN